MAYGCSGCATIAPGSAVTDVEFIVQGSYFLPSLTKTALQFSWQQNQDDYVIDVWGAFGKDERNCAALEKNAGYEGQKVIVAGPPELVMQQQLG